MKLLLSSLFILAFGSAMAQETIFVSDALPATDSSLITDIMISSPAGKVGNESGGGDRNLKNPNAAAPVPEPATLLALGAAGALFAARAKKKS